MADIETPAGLDACLELGLNSFGGVVRDVSVLLSLEFKRMMDGGRTDDVSDLPIVFRHTMKCVLFVITSLLLINELRFQTYGFSDPIQNIRIPMAWSPAPWRRACRRSCRRRQNSSSCSACVCVPPAGVTCHVSRVTCRQSGQLRLTHARLYLAVCVRDETQSFRRPGGKETLLTNAG